MDSEKDSEMDSVITRPRCWYWYRSDSASNGLTLCFPLALISSSFATCLFCLCLMPLSVVSKAFPLVLIGCDIFGFFSTDTLLLSLCILNLLSSCLSKLLLLFWGKPYRWLEVLTASWCCLYRHIFVEYSLCLFTKRLQVKIWSSAR